MPGQDVTRIRVGPGWLYGAPLTALEPADGDLTTPWATVDTSWFPFGYTQEGHSLTAATSYEGIEVAEELEPVRYDKASAENTLEFAMAQLTAQNASIAWNGGTIVTTGSGASTVKTFKAPNITVTPTEIKLGWEAFDGKERYVFGRTINTGDIEIARRKAPDKAMIPVSFKCMTPLSGLSWFRWILAEPV